MHENGEKADPAHDGQMHNNGTELAAAGAAAGQNPHAYQVGVRLRGACLAGLPYPVEDETAAYACGS
jgi:hypothetical protein